MTFLNPSILWGLLAISVPIIIHFFNFRRVKKVNFTNIALLKTVNTQAKSFLRLKQWLVLATRILFIGSLVLAFAQPFLPAKNGLNGSKSITSFYIDNSASMQNEADNKSALSLALKKLDRLASELPKATRNQLITNDFKTADYKIFNPAELKNEASKIEVSGAVRSLTDVFERQKGIVEKNSNSAQNNYFFFSDFQKSTAGNLEQIAADKTNNIYLVPNTTSQTKNVYVDSLWLDNPFIRKMQANGLSVRLKNSGTEAVKNLPIKLFLGDLQMNSIPTNIEGNGSQTIHFDFTINQSGTQKGKISFEDNPVVFDNEYFFVLNASPTINVFHLYNISSQNYYLKNAFSNDSLFKYNAFPIQNIDFGLLKNADLLILEGIDNFNTNSQEAVKSFLKSGGSVYLIPSQNPEMASYNSLLGSFGVQFLGLNDRQILDLKPLAEPQKDSEFYRDIFENTKIKDHLLMPNTGALLQWRTLGNAILRTKGGQNFLTTTVTNHAHIFIQASPLDEAFGNFPQNALFVPIVYKLAAMSIKPSTLAYRFDEASINLRDKEYSEKTIVKLKKDGVEIIPTQRVVGNEIILELPKANEIESGNLAGYYDMVVGQKVEKTLALNYNNSESLMDSYAIGDLKTIFAKNKNIKILDQENAADLATEYASQTQGSYFWKYFVIAALLFLALEILIIRFWK